MSTKTIAPTSHVGAVRAYLARWNQGVESAREATVEVMAPDCLWEQPGCPTTTSPAEAVELITQWHDAMGMDRVHHEMRFAAGAGARVFTERVNHIYIDDGTLVVSLPSAGVFEFDDDGRLTAWREYYDARRMQALLVATGVHEAERRPRTR